MFVGSNFERKFRDTKIFSDRCKLSQDLIAQFPECVPVIVERANDEKRLPLISKKQFLVPHEMTFSSFFLTIRKRVFSNDSSIGGAVSSPPNERRSSRNLGIWLYAGKTPITSPSSKMSEIYHLNKDIDGFLYLQYRGEHVFGSSAPSA